MAPRIWSRRSCGVPWLVTKMLRYLPAKAVPKRSSSRLLERTISGWPAVAATSSAIRATIAGGKSALRKRLSTTVDCRRTSSIGLYFWSRNSCSALCWMKRSMTSERTNQDSGTWIRRARRRRVAPRFALQDLGAEHHAAGLAADQAGAVVGADDARDDGVEVADGQVPLGDAHELELLADDPLDQRHAHRGGLVVGQAAQSARDGVEVVDLLPQQAERDRAEVGDLLEVHRLVALAGDVEDVVDLVGGEVLGRRRRWSAPGPGGAAPRRGGWRPGRCRPPARPVPGLPGDPRRPDAGRLRG